MSIIKKDIRKIPKTKRILLSKFEENEWVIIKSIDKKKLQEVSNDE